MIEFDYGRKPRYMVIGNMDIINSLEHWRAFGYIIGVNKHTEECDLELSFAFETKDSATKAYQAFQECIDAYKTEEIIDIIFVDDENKEEYTAFVTQNFHLLMEKALPTHLENWVHPLFTNAIQPKTFPKKSKEFLMLKKHKTDKNNVRVSFSYADPYRGFLPIERASFIKKDLLFLTEEEARSHDTIKGHFLKNQEELKKNQELAFSENGEDVIKQRWATLKYFYPVTLDKILVDGYLIDQIEHLKEVYEETEIYQAICNLIFQFRLKKNQVASRDWSLLDFLEYLLGTPETFNSLYPKDSYFCLDRIERQIKYKEKRRKK